MNRVKRFASCILLSIAILLCTVYTSPCYVRADDNLDNAVSDFLNNLGFPEIVYKTDYAKAALSDIESSTSIELGKGSYLGLVFCNQKPSNLDFYVTSGDTVVIDDSRDSSSSDWQESNGVYLMPFSLIISSEGVKNINVSLKFSEDTNYLLYIGGRNLSDNSDSSDTEEDEKISVPSIEIKEVKHSYDLSSYSSYYAFLKKYPSNIDGVEYEVYNKSGEKVYFSSTNDTEMYIADIKKSGIYYIRARAYRYDENGKEVCSKWAKKYFITAPRVKDLKSNKDVKINSVNLKWNKVSGASKYIIYCSKKSNGGWKKVGTTKRTSLKVTKFNGKKISITNGNEYYFKIEAIGKINGKTLISKTNNIVKCYRIL